VKDGTAAQASSARNQNFPIYQTSSGIRPGLGGWWQAIYGVITIVLFGAGIKTKK
jgi:hypothetical protein